MVYTEGRIRYASLSCCLTGKFVDERNRTCSEDRDIQNLQANERSK